MNPRNFLAELKRRNVYKVAVAYAVVAWLLIQVATQVFPFFEVPNWAVRLVVLLLILGWPVALVLAWAYEQTPKGFERSAAEGGAPLGTGGRGRVWIYVALLAGVLSAALFFLGRYTARNASAVDVPQKSIAVLPLENLSEEKENAFFADGIQDDVLTSLAKISDLKVISRTSVMQYRGAGGNRNLREIAQALGVENILEGSVRRVGNRVLVNVQLIDARRDKHIWAERYDRTIADSIGLQGELATEIATALRATLAPAEKARLEAKPTDNPEAYVFYLKAREREQGVDSTMVDRTAVEQLYEQAIALDPTFALAHSRLSMTNSFFYLQTQEQTRKLKARAAAEEALRLSPTLGEAHLALGFYFLTVEKDYNAALKELSIALSASPNNAEVLTNSGFIYRRQGRWREALASFERARDLDPRNATASRIVANNCAMVRDWPAATANSNRALEIAPKSVSPVFNLAYLEVYRNGNPTAAKAILSRIPAANKPDGFVFEANWYFSMFQRDFVAGEEILDGFPLEQLFPGNVLGQKALYQDILRSRVVMRHAHNGSSIR